MRSAIKKRLVCAGIACVGIAAFSVGAKVMAQNETKPQAALVCTLTTPELQERRAGVIKRLRESAQASRELDMGWSFRYSEGKLDDLVEFVRLERKCCNFFKFTLEFEAGAGPVWLSITGPAGAKAIIAGELGTVAERAPAKTE